MGVLGIDTSCYTTSVAYADGAALPAQEKKVLEVPLGDRGLMQSGAIFQHIKNLPGLLENLSEKHTGMRLDAVCASTRPRPVEGSYMPVFLCSESFGRSLASVLDVPFFSTSHQLGHLYAARYGSGLETDDYLAVHLSGGTTELLKVTGRSDIEMIGGTADLNAGQFVDRVGVALGMAFPSGPVLEKLARGMKAESILPLSPEGNYVHFSGAEAQIMRVIREGVLAPEQIAIEVYSYISRAIAYLIMKGYESTGIIHVLVAGGVASSRILRKMLPERLRKKHSPVKIYWGRPEYSSDNAVGAALIGLEKLREKGGSLC